MSVLPPSMHSRGVRYEWLVSPHECEVGYLSDEVLVWISTNALPHPIA